MTTQELFSADSASEVRRRALHPLIVRITHWVNAFAMICMIMSGWRIYNASPLFDFFTFPDWMTLGGWLAGAIAWHLAMFWLLIGNGFVYLVYGISSRHFRRRLLPVRAAAVWQDLRAALTFGLPHRPGVYNAVQRLLYVGVILLALTVVLSGLAVWKPVQLQEIAALLGGYEGARLVHFVAMSGIVAFIVIHLAMVAIVPKTLPAMIIGRNLGGTSKDKEESRS